MLPRGGGTRGGVSASRVGDLIGFGFRGWGWGRADGAGEAAAEEGAAGAAGDGLEGGGAGAAHPRAGAAEEEAAQEVVAGGAQPRPPRRAGAAVVARARLHGARHRLRRPPHQGHLTTLPRSSLQGFTSSLALAHSLVLLV